MVKKSLLSKIWKNSHKSYKIYQNFWAILEDGGFKIAPIKKKLKQNIGMHSLHRSKQKKVPHKIVQKLILRALRGFFKSIN